MSEPKGFFTYFHHAPILDALSDEQAGRLYKALMHYGSDGEVTDFSDDQALAITFSVFRNEINRNFERYQEICEKRSEAGKKSAQAKKEKAQEAKKEAEEQAIPSAPQNSLMNELERIRAEKLSVGADTSDMQNTSSNKFNMC